MSITYIGIIVSLLAGLANILNIKIAPEALQTTVEVIVMFAGAITAFIGRYRKGGINAFGMRNGR